MAQSPRKIDLAMAARASVSLLAAGATFLVLEGGVIKQAAQAAVASFDALYPENFAGVDDTAKIDAMFAYAKANNKRCIRFQPRTYTYSGVGNEITGFFWDICGAGPQTFFQLTTNVAFLTYDARTTSGGVSRIGNFQLWGMTAGMASSRVLRYRSDNNVFRVNHMTVFNIWASQVQDVVYFGKTAGDPWNGFDQLARYFGHRYVNITTSGNAGTLPVDGIVWEAGTGSHHRLSDCSLPCTNISIRMGDGDQAIHDTTMVNMHLLGTVGGLKMVGPTDPAKYRDANISLTASQCDGNTVFTWWAENIKRFRVRLVNQTIAASPVIINCTTPYEYEDVNGGIFHSAFEAPYVANGVSRIRFNPAVTAGVVLLDIVSSDTNVNMRLLPKNTGWVVLAGASPVVESPNGIRFSGSFAARSILDDAFLQFHGGSDPADAGFLRLYGKSHASLPGEAEVGTTRFRVMNKARTEEHLIVDQVHKAVSGFIGAVSQIRQSAVQTRKTGTTAESVLKTISVPAGVVGPNGGVAMEVIWGVNNSAGVKTGRVRIGAAGAGLAGTLMQELTWTTSQSQKLSLMFGNRNAENAQVGPSATQNGFNASASAPVVAAINTANAWEIVLTGELASGADRIDVDLYRAEISYGA